MPKSVPHEPSPSLANFLINSDGPMFSLDLHFRYTGYNRAHADGMKKLYNADIELGRSMAEYVTVEADWRFFKEKMQAALNGISSMATVGLGDAGLTRRFLAFFYSPIRAHQGDVEGIAVFAHILDGRPNEADSAIRSLQLSVESAAASIVITDTQANIEYVNAKFSECTGYSAEECMGKNPRMWKDPERPSHEYGELWATIISGKTWTGTFCNVKKDGSRYWEAAKISPVFDEKGKMIRYIAIKEDITEQRLAEEALRLSEAKYRELAQKIPISLCFVDNEERITFINERFTETFGYTEADLAVFADWWRVAFPEDKYRRWAIKTWSEVVMAAVLKKQDIEPREYKVVCKNGKDLTVLISGGIVKEGFLATFVDITERKRQERLLKAAFERKKKSSLMNELTTASLPSRQTLAAVARMLGMLAAEPFNCYLVMADCYKGKPRESWVDFQEEYQIMVDTLVDELSDDKCITWASVDGVGILCFGPSEAKTASAIKRQQHLEAEAFQKAIAKIIPDLDVSIGIADRASNLSEVGVHYRQAATAARSGRKMWPLRRVHHYLEIGVFQVLPYISDQKQVDAYISRTLGALLQYEKKKKVEFLQTLEMILSSDNMKEAADILGVHYKTLMFRKQRLEEILEVSLDNFSSRMAIATALNLMKLRSEKER